MSDVCFYGENVAAAFEGNVKGGAELQMMLLAKALAQNGITVTIIDPRVKSSSLVAKNLTLQGVSRWNGGIRGLRFFTHRIPNLYRACWETRARVFYVRGFAAHYLMILIVAKLTHAQFVFAVAHDTILQDFRARYTFHYRKNSSFWDWLSTNIPDELVAWIILRTADVVLVQNDHQAQLARARGIQSLRLNNVIDNDVFRFTCTGGRKNVVLVGAISVRKGLRSLIPIIKGLPHVVFEFIGDAGDIEGAEVKKELEKLPNVVLHGWLDRESTLRRIAAAKALVNVSLKEGFPNTFLEAWALGTPVVSLHVDPDNIIKTFRIGYFCHGDLHYLTDLLRQESYDLRPDSMRDYIVQNHSLDYAVDFFKKNLLGMAS